VDYANKVARVDVSVRTYRKNARGLSHRNQVTGREGISKCKTHYRGSPRGTGPHIIWSIKITQYTTQPCDACVLVACMCVQPLSVASFRHVASFRKDRRNWKFQLVNRFR